MCETTSVLLALSGWIKTGLVVVLLLTVLIPLLTLRPPRRRQGDAISDAEELGKLLGQRGRALTPLRPVGMCEFDQRKVECVAESGYVEEGTLVEVIRVAGTQPTVRVADGV